MTDETAKRIAEGIFVSEGIFGTDEENFRQRVPCVIIMDCSASMDGAPIESLNRGLKKFQEELNADKKALKSARIMLIRVGGFKGDPEEVQIRTPFQDATGFAAPTEIASGSTPLGDAVLLALKKIEEEKAYLRTQSLSYHRPWLFVMSDGKPDQGPAWDQACREAQQAISGKKVSVFPVAVDSGNPNELEQCIAELQKLTSRKVAIMNSAKFGEFFVFLSRSMSSASDTTAENPPMAPIADWSRA
jgi:uncharacterized protein YegL